MLFFLPHYLIYSTKLGLALFCLRYYLIITQIINIFRILCLFTINNIIITSNCELFLLTLEPFLIMTKQKTVAFPVKDWTSNLEISSTLLMLLMMNGGKPGRLHQMVRVTKLGWFPVNAGKYKSITVLSLANWAT